MEQRADIAAAAAEVLAETGQIDFVVNTAGVLPRGELAETTEETIYAATDVNYLAPIFIAQRFYPVCANARFAVAHLLSHTVTIWPLLSSRRAAVVDLTGHRGQAAASGVRVNRSFWSDGDPMRTKAFGAEPDAALLTSPAGRSVAVGPDRSCHRHSP